MNLKKDKKGVKNTWSFRHGPFLASSVLAIVIASIFISIGWSTGSGDEYLSTIPSDEFPYIQPSLTTTTPKPTDIQPSTTSKTPNTTTIEPEPTLPTTTHPTTVSTKTMGLTTAPVTFIIYSDFQCSHCQAFALTLEKQLVDAYVNTGKVLLEYKYIVAYGQESLLATEAAEAANEQDMFWPYHDLLMQQRASPKTDDLPVELLQFIAVQLGLDMEAFNASLQSGKYRGSILQESQDGMNLGVTSIPTFYINGFKKEGAKSFEDLQVIIDRILEGRPPDE